MLDTATVENIGEDVTETGPAPVARITSLRLDGRNVLHIGKRKVAIALLWQPRHEKLAIKQQAEAASSFNHEYDRYALHAGGKQIGLGASADGLTPGMVTGATLFDFSLLGRSFLAAFQVGPSHWWIVAHREGVVYDDVLINDEGDARLAMSDHLKAPDWGHIIAPVDWMIPNAVDAILIDSIGKTGAPIKPISFLRAYGARIALGFLLFIGFLAAFFAFSWFQAWQAEQQAEIDRMNAAMLRASAPKIVPYDKLPRLGTFVTLCEQEFENVIMLATGWDQNQLRCAVAPGKLSVETSWNRSGGRIQYLRAAKDDELPGDIILDPTGDRASLSYASEIIPENLGSQPWEASEVEAKLRERFQALGLELIMRPNIQRLTATQQRQLKDPVYNYHEVIIETTARLDEYVQLISDVPVVAAQSLIYDLAQSKWSLTFRVYHPVIMPPPPSAGE